VKLTRKGAKSTDSPIAVGPPQVNLLPPEVRAARAFGSVRRLLIFAMLASAFVAVGVAVFATLQVSAAQKALEDEQNRTQLLLAQQAQFSEVPKVLKALREATEAREFGMRTDVLWADYLRAIATVMPDDVSIDRLTVETEAPLQSLAPTQNPLVDNGVARITFSTRSATIPDTSAWLDALESLPGFRDAFFTKHPLTERDGSIHYEVESTIELDAAVYSGRFSQDASSDPADSTDTEKDGE